MSLWEHLVCNIPYRCLCLVCKIPYRCLCMCTVHRVCNIPYWWLWCDSSFYLPGVTQPDSWMSLWARLRRSICDVTWSVVFTAAAAVNRRWPGRRCRHRSNICRRGPFPRHHQHHFLVVLRRGKRGWVMKTLRLSTRTVNEVEYVKIVNGVE